MIPSRPRWETHHHDAFRQSLVLPPPAPVKFEIDKDYFEQILRAQAVNENELDLDKPYRKLFKFCESKNIKFTDFRKDLILSHAQQPSYFLYDGHWNPMGIKAAAMAIVNFWRDNRLPPFKDHSAR